MANKIFERFTQHASIQNKLMAMAKQLRTAKNFEARAKVATDRVRKEFFDFVDEAYGENTFAIFECTGEMEHMRVARELQEVRCFDVDMLEETLPADVFKQLVKRTIDTEKLDAMLLMRQVDSAIIADATSYVPRPNLTLRPTGARSEISLKPGEMAIVAPKHTLAVKQES